MQQVILISIQATATSIEVRAGRDKKEELGREDGSKGKMQKIKKRRRGGEENERNRRGTDKRSAPRRVNVRFRKRERKNKEYKTATKKVLYKCLID